MNWYQFLKEFVIYFFGTTDFALVLANFIFGCIGMFIMMLFDIMGRDKTKYKKFDFKYFWNDNGVRFLLNFFIMLVFIRFTYDFIKEPPTPKSSLMIGFLSDVIVLIVKKRKQKFKADNEDGSGLSLTETTTTTKKKETEIRTLTADVQPEIEQRAQTTQHD